MKIKTTSYTTRCHKKNKDYRLSIGISIDAPDGKVINTAATIQLHPIAYFVGKSPATAFNLLYLSAIVYAIDRAVKRHDYSIDGWSREFDVDICIPGHEAFRSHEEQINRMLSFLTGDYWACHFIESATVTVPHYSGHTNYFDNISQVNLFSGGMDSLIGAIDYMASKHTGKVFLASHYDSIMTGPLSDQKKLIKAFKRKYPNDFCTFFDNTAVMIDPKVSLELSCRSRSLMFISIALVVASFAKCDVVVPENGSVSLNYPLSASRRASCSTRTTHPVFLKQLGVLISDLGFLSTIRNPYEKMTKREMVQNCDDKAFLLQIVANSNSCGKRSQHQYMYDNPSATHCGHCMPCMYRKAALLGEEDPTTYGNRFITLFKKRDNRYQVSYDFFAMLEFLKRDLSEDEIRRELRIAGMASFDDLDDYVDLVIRTRAELSEMVRADNNIMILKYLGWEQ